MTPTFQFIKVASGEPFPFESGMHRFYKSPYLQDIAFDRMERNGNIVSPDYAVYILRPVLPPAADGGMKWVKASERLPEVGHHVARRDVGYWQYLPICRIPSGIIKKETNGALITGDWEWLDESAPSDIPAGREVDETGCTGHSWAKGKDHDTCVRCGASRITPAPVPDREAFDSLDLLRWAMCMSEPKPEETKYTDHLQLVDGLFFWSTDNEGDQPLEAEDMLQLYLKDDEWVLPDTTSHFPESPAPVTREEAEEWVKTAYPVSNITVDVGHEDPYEVDVNESAREAIPEFLDYLQGKAIQPPGMEAGTILYPEAEIRRGLASYDDYNQKEIDDFIRLLKPVK